MNPLLWTKPQWDAAGRHLLTFLGTIMPLLVLTGIIKPDQAGTWTAWITNLFGAVATLVLAIAPIYAAVRAAMTASPENQAVQTVKNLEAGIPLNGKRDQLIAAVAEQPDVAKVEMVNPNRAETILSDKVV
jgi:hypothetical protein